MSASLSVVPAVVAQSRQAFLTECGNRLLAIDALAPVPAPLPGRPFVPAIAAWILREQHAPIDFYAPDAPMRDAGFGECCARFLRACLPTTTGWPKGSWQLYTGNFEILQSCQQYAHWAELTQLALAHPTLTGPLAHVQTWPPDLLLARQPHPQGRPLTSSVLHAAIAPLLYLRGEQAAQLVPQARALLRERRGRAPHVVVVTAEPLPSRLASIALGTGDLDCTYHFALYELQAAMQQHPDSEAAALIEMMVEGRRLKDISDLPLDLAV